MHVQGVTQGVTKLFSGCNIFECNCLVLLLVLNKAVKRNQSRFPPDFMFQLSAEEAENLMFQIGISSLKHGGRRKPISVFTEQGVAMLSTVLRSERAVQVNIAIMRAFVQLRQILGSHAELARKLAELERRIEGHDSDIRSLF